MPRLKVVPVAVALVALSAGAVYAYRALPDAASHGLDVATEAPGRDVPARTHPAPPRAAARGAPRRGRGGERPPRPPRPPPTSPGPPIRALPCRKRPSPTSRPLGAATGR